MSDYSLIDDYEDLKAQGFEEIKFTEIQKGDCFFENGGTVIYKAVENVHLTDLGDGYIVEAEDADFETKTFGHAKNAMAYAPKYFRVVE